MGLGQSVENPSSLCHICQTEGQTVDVACKDITISCLSCGRPYGQQHASSVDPTYCRDCGSDFQVRKERAVKEEVIRKEDFDLDKDIVLPPIIRRTSCVQIHLSGTSWMFHQEKIQSLNEEQLKLAIQWHRTTVALIEHEIIERKIKKAKELQGVKVTIRRTTKETRTTSVKRKKKGLTQDQLTAMAALLSKMTPEQLAALGVVPTPTTTMPVEGVKE